MAENNIDPLDKIQISADPVTAGSQQINAAFNTFTQAMFLGGFSHGKGEQPEKPDETPETESKEHVASIPEHGYHRTSLDSNRDEMRSVHSADKSNSMTSHSDRVESDHVNGSNHTHDNVHRTQHNSRNFHNRL